MILKEIYALFSLILVVHLECEFNVARNSFALLHFYDVIPTSFNKGKTLNGLSTITSIILYSWPFLSRNNLHSTRDSDFLNRFVSLEKSFYYKHQIRIVINIYYNGNASRELFSCIKLA